MTAPELSPREAVERWLGKQRVEKRESTVSAYWYRLRHFVRWCEDQDVATLHDLDGWGLETYEMTRRERGLAVITLEKELLTLKQFLRWAGGVGLADPAIHEVIEPPQAGPHAQTSDTLLEAATAKGLLAQYRAGGAGANSLEHVFLELAWYTCARLGALRGLDPEDVDGEAGVIRFRHRPETGTPLKNGRDGERPVPVPGTVLEVIRRYQHQTRHDITDEHERRPLLTTEHGRASPTTLRAVAYYATVPCRYRDCPHDKERRVCEWYGRRAAVECPSSRSPHQIRTGSITWHLTRGVPIEAIATKADSSVDTIRRHYDQPTDDDLTARQDPHLEKLTFDDDTE